MSSIAGFFHPFYDYSNERSLCERKIRRLSRTLLHRGPDQQHFYFSGHACLNHNFLFSGQTNNPKEDFYYEPLPATKKFRNAFYTIGYDGAIQNLKELSEEMQSDGVNMEELSEAELLLCAYLHYGSSFVQKLNGGFSMFLLDEAKNQLFLFRDPLGIKPLFYSLLDQTLIFASELKGVLTFPGISPGVSRDGLNEIFSLGSIKTPGSGVFSDIYELKPGHLLCYGQHRLSDECYFHFPSTVCTDSYEEVLLHTWELVSDSVQRQMTGNAPLGCFLSGGLSSSVVAALCVKELPTGKLSTFSFDFARHAKSFSTNSTPLSLDEPFAREMAELLHAKHTCLECSSRRQFSFLSASVAAHDLPCMADLDASLLYFCRLAASNCKIILTGECADAIFCGYPWFQNDELSHINAFPWEKDLSSCFILLKDNLIKTLDIPAYLEHAYQASCHEYLPGDALSDEMEHHQRLYFLTLRYYMQMLLDRIDRTAAQSGLDARIPFADLRLVSYLFTVPHSFKAKDGVEKQLLREAFSDLLPESIRQRKKCPYPRTCDSDYETLLAARLRTILSDSNSPLLELVEPKKVLALCQNPKEFGALMANSKLSGAPQTTASAQLSGAPQNASRFQLSGAPQPTARTQLMAYYIQINEWLQKYQIKIKL